MKKKRLKLKWLFNSALFRVIFLTIILIVPINIITLFMSTRAITKVENQISFDTQNALKLNMNQLDYLLRVMNYRLYYLGFKDEDFAWLNSKTATNEDELAKQMRSMLRLRVTLDEISQNHPWVDGAFVYFPDKDYFIYNSTYIAAQARTEIMNIINENDKSKFGKWIAIEDLNILARVVKYKNSYYGAWVDLSILEEEFQLKDSDNFIVFVVKDGTIISNDEELKELDLLENGQIVTYKGEKYITLKAESEQGNLVMVEMLSRDTLQKSLPSYIRIMRYVVALALLFIPILIYAYVRWMIRPIMTVVDAMTAVEQGNLEYRIKQKDKLNEFELINRNFNQMMDSVMELRINVYEKELEKQNIKMKYLSQQIQPHFMLNAMNIIYSYEPEEYPLIQKMVLCLSKYYQSIVNANRPYVKLKYELEHIDNYLAIQKIRYPERLSYEVRCYSQVEDYVIPPLIVQNLAENVIKYALPDEGMVKVFISAFEEDGRIVIMIIDNGNGIKRKTLEKIKHFKETGEPQKGLGIGIQNTIERLNLFFGDEADFEIDKNLETGGTIVKIVIPFRLGEVDEDECDNC